MLLFFARLLATFVHIALVVVLAPLLPGLVTKFRARLLGGRGPALAQPYRDLIRLARKTTLLPETATDLFPIWPLACFAVLAVAAMLTPGFCTGLLTASSSDFITIIFLLTLAQAIQFLAALETGFGPGGVTVSRQVMFGLFGQAALLSALLSLALLAHSTSLDGIVIAFRTASPGLSVPLGFALLAMLTVALCDRGLMLAEYSGRYLLLFEATTMLRLMIWMCLIGAIFLPFGMARADDLLSWPGGLLLWWVKLGLMCAGLAVFQVFMARPQVFRVPQWLGLAAVFGVVSAVVLLIAQTGG